jgi:hypothetical protein
MLKAPAKTRDWMATDISCPSARLCVIVGELEPERAGPTYAFVGMLAGRQWSGPQPVRSATLLNAVSCQAPGSCVAVGEDAARPVIVTESGGRWHKAVTVDMARLKPSGDIENTLTSVACNHLESCVAVGSYSTLQSGGPAGRPMIVVGLDGTWRPAQAIGPPKGIGAWPTFANTADPGTGPVGFAGLYGVSCLARGSCVAVGSYLTSGLQWRGFTVTQLKGHTGHSQGGLPLLRGITCTSHNCLSLASNNAGSSGGYGLNMTITYSGDHWHSAMLIKPPANANKSPQMSPVTLRDVACFATGGCIAVGDYQTNETIPSHRLLIATRP